MENTIGLLCLVIAVSIVMKRLLANKTVIYDTEIKTYKFEPEVCYQKGKTRQNISLFCVFEEGIRQKNPMRLSAVHTKVN